MGANESIIVKDDAEQLAHATAAIAQAFATGVCSDISKLELLASQLADIRVDIPRQLTSMLDAVRFLYVSGHAFSGLVIAQKAQALGLECAQSALTGDALLLIGVCSADTGDLATAMEAYASALTLATGTNDAGRQRKILHNLGSALAYAGMFREALASLYASLAGTEGEPGLISFRSAIYTNIATCHLNLDEIGPGLEAIQKSIDLAQEPDDVNKALNRVLAEGCYTRLLLEVNKFEAAKDHAKLARKYASQSKSPRADIFAAVAEGLAEVFSGQADVGITRLVNTLDRAKMHKITTRDVLIALVKAFEFIGKPDHALVYLRQLLDYQSTTQKQNILRHVKLHLEQLHPALEDEANVIRRLTTRQEVLEGRVAKQALFKAQVESMERMAVVAELRDDSTGAHSYRVGRLASLLAKENGCDEETIFMIDIAARLHDIGKVGIPDGILLKPAKLNAAEREVMKTHTTIGAEVLANSNIAHMQTAEEIARFHHEWWDGTGYPSGLAGENIPIAARITALADVFDALAHKRPYKEAWPVDSTLTEIMALKGRQFDPKLTDLFLGLVARLRREHADLDAFLGEAANASPFLQARAKIKETLAMTVDGNVNGAESRLNLQR